MVVEEFQRARSVDAKRSRERAILDAARGLAERRVVRDITLTEIAEAVGMHKSGMLRYFETREEIFLRLTAEDWRKWGPDLRARLDAITTFSPDAVGAAFASTLASRPTFCDLLAHAPLNLERNVSLDAVLAFKLVTLEELDAIVAALQRLVPTLSEQHGVDMVTAAVSLTGAMHQMATPGPTIETLYRTDPRLVHAVLDVEPRVAAMLSAMLSGFLTPRSERTPE